LRIHLTLDTLRQLLTRYPDDRLTASAFQHSPLFDNILMNSIRFLDSFPEKSKNEKTSFLRGFVGIIPQFSDRIRQRKILPALLGYVQDTDLLPLLLPNIFAITKNMSQLSFSERVLPTVKDIINMKELPDNVTVTLLDSINHLKDKTTGKEFADGTLHTIAN
jgi:SCY1-like protein 2